MEEPPSGRILVVDDDPGLRALLRDFLTNHNFSAEAVDGVEAMDRRLATESYDVVVLDVMMPGEGGLSACRRLSGRADGPAVIMLSAMGDEIDRIVGLELGADDYLAKPCNPRELLARIKAVMRRRAGGDPGSAADYSFAGWRLDILRRELRSAKDVVSPLSGGEFSLLRAFLERPNQVLSRDKLLEAARGEDSEAFDRAIDVQVSRLRRKLGDSRSEAALIRTVRNEGYIFTARVRRL